MTARFGGGLPGNFWRLWSSSAGSNLADGIMTVVLPVIAIGITRDPLLIAGVSVAINVPSLLFGLVAGGLADRMDRRITMLAVQLVRASVLGGLTVLAVADALTIPLLYGAAFVWGAAETFFDTNAQSIVPDLVGRDRLVAANGRLYAAETMMNSFVGPPVGGLLIAVSAPLALAGSTAAYVVAAVGLASLRGTFRPERRGPQRHLLTEIGEGMAYLARHRLLATLSGLVAAGRLGSGMTFAILALYAVAPGPMGLSEPGFGLLFVMFGVGSLFGSLLAAPLVASIGRSRVLGAAQLVFGLTLAVPALTTNAIAVGASFLVAGVSVMAWNITNVSLRQTLVPAHLLGRVHATHRFVANVAGLVGALAGGALAASVGLTAVFWAGAAVVLASLAALTVVTDTRIADAQARTDAEATTAAAEDASSG
jgi:MFS family permease